MVGLPARGKTYLARKLAYYLNWVIVETKSKSCNATCNRRCCLQAAGWFSTAGTRALCCWFETLGCSSDCFPTAITACTPSAWAPCLVDGHGHLLPPSSPPPSVFNLGVYRRRLLSPIVPSDFFDPDNAEAREQRR